VNDFLLLIVENYTVFASFYV